MLICLKFVYVIVMSETSYYKVVITHSKYFFGKVLLSFLPWGGGGGGGLWFAVVGDTGKDPLFLFSILLPKHGI